MLLFSIFTDCEKQAKYDLYPLKAGNEFYFNYSKYEFNGPPAYTTGKERWKVISETIQENSRIYRIERKLDAVFQIMNITAIIKDSIRYLDVEEDISTSELLFYSHKFRRYQPEPQYEIKEEASTMHSSSSYLFKADSGLTKYRYYHPPNHIVEETLILDSVSITP